MKNVPWETPKKKSPLPFVQQNKSKNTQNN